MFDLKGVIPAVPTIFMEDETISAGEILDVISFLMKSSVDGIAVNLMGGESYKLNTEEKIKLMSIALEGAKSNLCVYAGISEQSTFQASLLAKIAEDIGVGCLIVMPPYSDPLGKYSNQALLKHINQIASTINIPFIIQDFNFGIPLYLMKRLAREFSNFIGIKIEGYKKNYIIRRIKEIRREMGDKFSIFGGMLGLNMHNEIKYGATGTIPGSSLADFISIEYHSLNNLKEIDANREEKLKKILLTEVRHFRHFVYLEKRILKHRGIIDHVLCRSPYDYPSEAFVKKLLVDVDLLIAGN